MKVKLEHGCDFAKQACGEASNAPPPATRPEVCSWQKKKGFKATICSGTANSPARLAVHCRSRHESHATTWCASAIVGSSHVKAIEVCACQGLISIFFNAKVNSWSRKVNHCRLSLAFIYKERIVTVTPLRTNRRFVAKAKRAPDSCLVGGRGRRSIWQNAAL